MSLPASPSSTSSPRIPRRRSLPPRPTRRSAPRVPFSVSSPSVPTSSARPGCTTTVPGVPETWIVFSRLALKADRTDTVCAVASETYRREASGAYAARPGPPPVGGRAITRRFARSTKRGLAVDALQMRAGGDDRLGPVGRHADAAAAVGPELDRAGEAPAVGVDAHDPRGRLVLALLGLGGADPGVAGLVDPDGGRARDLHAPDEVPGREVEDRHLPAALDDDRAGVGDDEVQRRAGQRAHAEVLDPDRVDHLDPVVARRVQLARRRARPRSPPGRPAAARRRRPCRWSGRSPRSRGPPRRRRASRPARPRRRGWRRGAAGWRSGRSSACRSAPPSIRRWRRARRGPQRPARRAAERGRRAACARASETRPLRRSCAIGRRSSPGRAASTRRRRS